MCSPYLWALPDLYEGKLQSGGYDEDTGRKNAGETIRSGTGRRNSKKFQNNKRRGN